MTIEPVDRSTAEHYVWRGVCDGWHLVRTPKLSVIQERMPPGSTEQTHYHTQAQQFFYVLSGEAVIEIDGREVRLITGQGIYIAPGTTHQMKNRSAGDVEFLVISQPPSHGDRILAPGPVVHCD